LQKLDKLLESVPKLDSVQENVPEIDKVLAVFQKLRKYKYEKRCQNLNKKL